MTLDEVKTIAKEFFPSAYVEDAGPGAYRVRPYKSCKKMTLLSKTGGYTYLRKKLASLYKKITKDNQEKGVVVTDSFLNDQIEEHERLMKRTSL